MSMLWQSVIDSLGAADARWCLLRGGNNALPAAAQGDVDLLVEAGDLRRVERLLAGLGFVRLRAWGFAPHRFFIGYDERSDCWLKLDIVDRIAFGSPAHSIETDLAPVILQHRRTRDVPVPAPEHELITLLLHAVIDKQRFPAERLARCQELCGEVDPAEMAALVSRYWMPGATWADLRDVILAGRCRDLFEERRAIVRHLTCRQVLRHRWRKVRDRVLRKCGRLARLFRRPAPAVALLAPDGAGKSTLAAGLCESFFFPVRRVYMGLPVKRPLRRWLPGAGFARLVMGQWWRYVTARFHCARGRLVVFDRYTYDALLPPPYRLNRLRRMRRWLLAHACPAPDLIVVLDAPGEILHERKGEHTVAHLEAQRQAYRALPRNLPQTVVIDATRAAGQVRSDVTAAIWRRYQERELPRGGRR